MSRRKLSEGRFSPSWFGSFRLGDEGNAFWRASFRAKRGERRWSDMTSTMQTPIARKGRGASRAFALRHRDPVGIGKDRRDFAKESAA
jgi:hypothetical protein